MLILMISGIRRNLFNNTLMHLKSITSQQLSCSASQRGITYQGKVDGLESHMQVLQDFLGKILQLH